MYLKKKNVPEGAWLGDFCERLVWGKLLRFCAYYWVLEYGRLILGTFWPWPTLCPSAILQLRHRFEIIMIQDCIPVGCVPPARWPYNPACSAPGGGAWFGGCLLPGGSVCSHGGCLVWGGRCLVWGVWGIPVCTEADPPCEQNHTRLWKYNLTPTSSWAVIISYRCVMNIYYSNFSILKTRHGGF